MWPKHQPQLSTKNTIWSAASVTWFNTESFTWSNLCSTGRMSLNWGIVYCLSATTTHLKFIYVLMRPSRGDLPPDSEALGIHCSCSRQWSNSRSFSRSLQREQQQQLSMGGGEKKKRSARGSWQHAATRLQTLSPRTAEWCHVKGNGSVHLLKPCIRYSFETQQPVKAYLLGGSFLMSCHKPVHTDGTEWKKLLVFFSSCINSFIWETQNLSQHVLRLQAADGSTWDV